MDNRENDSRESFAVAFNLDPRSTTEFIHELVESLFARKREQIADLEERLSEMRADRDGMVREAEQRGWDAERERCRQIAIHVQTGAEPTDLSWAISASLILVRIESGEHPVEGGVT